VASSGEAGIVLGCPRWIGLCGIGVAVRKFAGTS
jgi:hypothetical protein